ncbi:TIGR04283 family arsenosugar biosynthesis glycosyltransferase [Aporhodopirellula aestuarii]|uniref:TIGR04283 family arsenosugar biosynthesis glycosyltransferase n=1 Tax=Aporhodopirellula aestuarii TaxID=2950107 RepID=A0ABT0UCN5_9BACT|nr:TIGR04283 family arsenosugar biosynthesis glycosyltransferase [Aporhodopirellula aestuarii]MCM2374611.1 TIGR04283 family arsenosugar biosynthesis glycosyltransferase [Aporhodopirellula aestuarii]
MSVIIPTWNESKSIHRCLASASALRPLEIIVSDGGSEDGTCGKARRFAERCSSDVIVVDSPFGRGRQLAQGAAVARGDVLLFLHADSALDKHSLDQMRKAGWPAWGGFHQRITEPRWRFRLIEFGNALRVRTLGRVFGDQAIYVHRDWYDRAGGFAEVALMEDVLLSSRLRRMGRPRLLPGPVHVDPRRWLQRGVIRQTWLNWQIQVAFARGAAPDELRKRYDRTRHD